MESTPQHNAIGNQLIVYTIASYLTPPNLAKCLRLCRFWNRELIPYFFRKLSFKEYHSFHRLMTNDDALRVVRQNMHHVRELNCAEENISGLFTDHPLPNLTCLRMSPNVDYETSFLSIFKSSPQIHTLEIVQTFCYEKGKLLPNMINDITRHLPSLRCLDLGWEGEVDQATLGQILCLAAGLEIVRLNITIRSTEIISTPLTSDVAIASLPAGGDVIDMDPQRAFLNTFSETIALKATSHRAAIDDNGSSSLSIPVKELCFSKLGVFDSRDFPLFNTFLRYCHRLEKLALPAIRVNKDHHSVPAFYLDLLSACVSTLQYLDVFSAEASGQVIAAVIQKCVRLRGFQWGYNQRDPELVYNALVAHHRASLEDIGVSGTYCTHLAPASSSSLAMNVLIHRMLCSFPHLRRFEALVIDRHFWYADHSVSSMDLKGSSGCFTDWVCKNLTTISLRFVPGKAYARLRREPVTIDDCVAYRLAFIFPEVLCAQLCRLEKLEKLRLAVDVNSGLQRRQEDEDNDPCMSMREALSNIQGSLKNLRMLELRNLNDFVDSSAMDEHPLIDLVLSRDP
ncbi:hypothetical protein BG004_006214 [Podila humilis]|nr:hypothetical protein BG004_006214 [Podila humilis]